MQRLRWLPSLIYLRCRCFSHFLGNSQKTNYFKNFVWLNHLPQLILQQSITNIFFQRIFSFQNRPLAQLTPIFSRFFKQKLENHSHSTPFKKSKKLLLPIFFIILLYSICILWIYKQDIALFSRSGKPNQVVDDFTVRFQLLPSCPWIVAPMPRSSVVLATNDILVDLSFFLLDAWKFSNK